MKRRGFIGCIVGFVTYVALLVSVVPPAKCADGTISTSIGRRGACSWHGGVQASPWALVALLGSIGLGISIAKWPEMKRYVRERSERVRDAKEAEEARQTPYGSLKNYEALLRQNGLSEDLIAAEVARYRSSNKGDK